MLLLDEPMAALDAHTRADVRAELQELLRDLGLPTILVTHDFEDAAALADRVGVISDGKVLQVGPPDELVAAPADAFVASFTGGNLLHGFARSTREGLTEVVLDGGAVVFSTDRGEGRVGVVVYPWEVSIAPHGGGRLGAEPRQRADRLPGDDRKPRAGAGRPARRRGDRVIGGAARPRARADRRRLVQGDRRAARSAARA